MTEFFLVDVDGRIVNVVSGDHMLTIDRAALALRADLHKGEKIIRYPTRDQLLEYEQRTPR